MINNFKYQAGDKVKCIYTTLDNHENLVEGNTYTVIGAQIVHGDVIYSLEVDGKIYYSIDRFEKAWIPKEKPDMINPSHYKQGKVECIDAIESATVNKTGIEAVCVANVIKYLWRYESKNGLEDVEKMLWYGNKLKEVLVEREKKRGE